MLVLKTCFYLTFIPHAIIFVFSIFNNIEEIGLVKKLLVDEKGHMVVKRLLFLRFLLTLIVFGPMFFIKDILFLTVVTGSVLCPIIGLIWPVS